MKNIEKEKKNLLKRISRITSEMPLEDRVGVLERVLWLRRWKHLSQKESSEFIDALYAKYEELGLV